MHIQLLVTRFPSNAISVQDPSCVLNFLRRLLVIKISEVGIVQVVKSIVCTSTLTMR